MNNMTLLGTWLAKELALNPRYFSKIYARAQKGNTTLSRGVEIKKQAGMIFVALPPHVVAMINDPAYTAAQIQPEDEERDYDHVFQLTRDVRIGFWK